MWPSVSPLLTVFNDCQNNRNPFGVYRRHNIYAWLRRRGLLMAIESACIPLPSEIIMPFSGYLVSKGEMNLWLVGLAGAVGCVLGSMVAYWVGMYGGRPLIEKYGRYILISHHDLDLADRWFAKYGEVIVFASRLLPAIRTFIAFPAGVARMNIPRFIIYTFAGSLPWCLGLAYVGQKLGEKWDQDPTLKNLFHRFDFVIGIILVLGAAWWIWRTCAIRRRTGKGRRAKNKADE
jgi:membrane protein DedA with SNARE-associated domain